MVTPDELQRGLVLRFDPDVLASHGAVADTWLPSAVRGVHYFVCISRVPGLSVWVPAYSRQTSGRIALRWKGGEPSWVEPESYIDLMQMWYVPDRAVEAAACEQGRTRRGHRNQASLYFLLGAHVTPASRRPASPSAAA